MSTILCKENQNLAITTSLLIISLTNMNVDPASFMLEVGEELNAEELLEYTNSISKVLLKVYNKDSDSYKYLWLVNKTLRGWAERGYSVRIV